MHGVTDFFSLLNMVQTPGGWLTHMCVGCLERMVSSRHLLASASSPSQSARWLISRMDELKIAFAWLRLKIDL